MILLPAKLCGLRTVEHATLAVQHHAAFIGFVFAPQSPRYITPEEAGYIVRQLPAERYTSVVGVCVDPTDDELTHILHHIPIDMVQLHGTETPQRVAECAEHTLLPMIKAINIRNPHDVALGKQYPHAAMLLFDGATAGHGHPFDASLLHQQKFAQPYFIAGGLNADNVLTQWQASGAHYVDVSSGIEHTRGIKDSTKMIEFLQVVAQQKSAF